MSLFDRLFGSSNVSEEEQPDIRFGRYSDTYKSSYQRESWNKALTAFEKGKYIASYRLFFQYLRDEKEKNVKISENNKGEILFEILQGSKRILGVASRKKVTAEAKVVRAEELDISFMRRLMEENYSLQYSRFALDNTNNVTISFNTYVLDGSPYKLYHALKEVATRADKMDDLLIEEFNVLHQIPMDEGLQIPIDTDKKEIKYQFIVDNIKTVLEEIEKERLKQEEYPGAIAYLLLSLCYKLDFLVVPQGHLMESLERINRMFFSKNSKTNIQKNIQIQKEYRKLLNRSKEEYYKELYHVASTFGITDAVTHERVVSFIQGELGQMDWYLDNNYKAIALAVPSYIVGYCLFQFAVPKPDRELFLLYYQITEWAYFEQLGFTYNFVEKGKKLNKKAIKKAIDKIVEENSASYPNFHPKKNELDFQSMEHFAKSFLLMVKELDLIRNE